MGSSINPSLSTFHLLRIPQSFQPTKDSLSCVLSLLQISHIYINMYMFSSYIWFGEIGPDPVCHFYLISGASSLKSVLSLSPFVLSDLVSLCLSLSLYLWPWFRSYISLRLHLILMISIHDFLSPWFLSASLPHHALISVAAPHQLEALAPMAGWLWSSLWVGSPRLLQRGIRISNTCSLWQPATTAHCLPTSHFNLKRENCQTNVLATAPCQGFMGNLTAAPARS